MVKSGIGLAAVAALALAGCGKPSGDTTANNASAAEPPVNASAGSGKTDTPILTGLQNSGEHGTFANAVKAAGLTQTFSGAQPYTVFAPTDAAFQKLTAGTVDSLMAADAKGRLVSLITGHMVQGFVTAGDLGHAIDRGKGKAQLATIGGGTLTFTRSGDNIVVADTKCGQGTITHADITQSNGIVHSIDTVLGAK